jgi:hypothetical protein
VRVAAAGAVALGVEPALIAAHHLAGERRGIDGAAARADAARDKREDGRAGAEQEGADHGFFCFARASSRAFCFSAFDRLAPAPAGPPGRFGAPLSGFAIWSSQAS